MFVCTLYAYSDKTRSHWTGPTSYRFWHPRQHKSSRAQRLASTPRATTLCCMAIGVGVSQGLPLSSPRWQAGAHNLDYGSTATSTESTTLHIGWTLSSALPSHATFLVCAHVRVERVIIMHHEQLAHNSGASVRRRGRHGHHPVRLECPAFWSSTPRFADAAAVRVFHARSRLVVRTWFLSQSILAILSTSVLCCASPAVSRSCFKDTRHPPVQLSSSFLVACDEHSWSLHVPPWLEFGGPLSQSAGWPRHDSLTSEGVGTAGRRSMYQKNEERCPI